MGKASILACLADTRFGSRDQAVDVLLVAKDDIRSADNRQDQECDGLSQYQHENNRRYRR